MARSISRRRILKGGALVAASSVTTFSIARAQAWPSKPIRIICAFPAGGLTDAFSRAYGDYIQEKTGQTVIVENKTGAGGGVAAQALKATPPDGHTLMCTVSSTLLGNRVLYKNLPYDPDKDFSFISLHPSGQLPLVVHKDTGAKSIADFAAYAKANKVSGGSYSPGSFAHIALDQLNKHFGTTFPVVNYRGEAPMWQDMAAGVLQIANGSYQAAQSVLQSGVGVPIAVPTKKRMKALPNVPTFFEQGITAPVFQLLSWICMLGPAGMPEELVAKISNMIVEGGKSEKVRRLLDTFAIDEAAMDYKALRKYYAEEGPVWIEHAKMLNLKAE